MRVIIATALVAGAVAVAPAGSRLSGAAPVIHVTPEGWTADVPRLVRVSVAAAAGGAAAIQVRDPRAPRAAVAEAAAAVAAAVAGSGTAVVLNGAPADAAARGVGAHLGERAAAAPGAQAAREAVPLLGVSAHSVAAALRGAALGADYVQLGTMFATRTHPGKVPEGVALAEAVAAAFARLDRPPRLVGVGGVDAANAGRLAAAGCDGAAVIRAISDAADPAAAVRDIRRALLLRGGRAAGAARASEALPPEFDAPD